VPAIGFYDGLFGPGTGTFFMLGLVTLLGMGVLRATVHTKIANAGSNLGSLAVFAAMGAIDLKIGLAMAAGAFTGAQIGARLAMRFGSGLIRPLLVVVCCALAFRLLSDPANPVRQMLH
ncbi:MAG: TSUP family transporter, partial [Hyphomicrobium sp.]